MSIRVRGKQVSVRSIAIWTAVALLGAVSWGILALARGEEINAVWLLFAAVCSYAIAYRYVEHRRREHPDDPVMSRRDFERWRMDERDANPSARCC